jgi:NAD(P)-dependent dehydrogenase (short-subunit alcohol dehydrogenase family)
MSPIPEIPAGQLDCARDGGMTRDAVLVTGGNSGIGFECALQLARDGWQVVIASRNRALSQRAVQRIQHETGNADVSEFKLDLGSLAAIRQFARDLDPSLGLRALVCNAGLQTVAGLSLTPDGFESTFAVNHLGHFLLVQLLLSRLLANAPARIVVVASGVHDPQQKTGMPKASITDFATLAASGGPRRGEYNGRLAYVNSKLCNMWFTYEMARRLAAADIDSGKVTVNAFDPGLVPGSGLGRDYPDALRFVWHRILPSVAAVLSPIIAGINPAPKAGRALARLVVDPALAGVSGKYFPSTSRWREDKSSEASYDCARARELWDESIQLSGMATNESILR